MDLKLSCIFGKANGCGELVSEGCLEILAAISLQSLMTSGHSVFEIFQLLGNKNGRFVTVTLQEVVSIPLWLKV